MLNLFITGTNRGLGLELAKIAAKRGHHVIAAMRTPWTEEEKQAIFNKEEGQVDTIELDVVNEESVKQAAEIVKDKWGSVDVIVNNAAILAGRDQTLDELDFSLLEESFQVNVYGPMRVVKHFLPLLHEGSNGSVINISSESGSLTNAYGGDYPYALTKTALNMFSQQLHQLLKEHSIPVYAIHPGWMRTDMGGPNASLDPSESALSIVKLIEERPSIDSVFRFVDYEGRPMSI